MKLSKEEQIKITQDLAAALGADWSYDQQEHYTFYINGKNYRRLRLDFYYNKIYAILPENKFGTRHNFNHIGCTLTRLSKHLARDIKSRLLPGYSEAVERTRKERFDHLRSKQPDLVMDAVSRFYPLRNHYNGGYVFGVTESVQCRIEKVRGRPVLTISGLSDDELIKLTANLKGIL